MHVKAFVLLGLIIVSVLALVEIAGAQPPPSPMIHRVTVQPDSGVLTITGTGLGPDLFVTVDGLSVSVLAGATDTQIDVMTPATVLTTAGTYRLTVIDPVRRLGDAFVVASPAATIAVGNAVPTATTAPASVPVRPGPTSVGSAFPAARRSGQGPGPLFVEDAGGLFRTALGHQALGANTTGTSNTAIGAFALADNTVGTYNTASGFVALTSNTTGSFNTASGHHALFLNTAGQSNTATGADALYSNETGSYNTATGFAALLYNTTGHDNTATGYQALWFNSTGFYNTASGYKALNFNTTGTHNTASGAAALLMNTTGGWNTASGEGALYENTTGAYNTASGGEALFANTTGRFNSAHGYLALSSNTTGLNNTATGTQALSSNDTGSFNTANGLAALHRSTGDNNTAVGHAAGFNATTGSYNLYFGASVQGTPGDTNSIRIGLPYSGGVGQNRTFVAGIHGTVLTGPAVQVFVDANGQLGTLTPPVVTGTVTVPLLQQQMQEQQAINAELRERLQAQQATIDGLLARLARLEEAGARRR